MQLARLTGVIVLEQSPDQGQDERHPEGVTMHAPRGTSAAITTVLIALMTTGSVSTARGDANQRNVRLLAVQPDARCGGLAATILGTEGPDRLRGTPDKDVIVGLGC